MWLNITIIHNFVFLSFFVFPLFKSNTCHRSHYFHHFFIQNKTSLFLKHYLTNKIPPFLLLLLTSYVNWFSFSKNFHKTNKKRRRRRRRHSVALIQNQWRKIRNFNLTFDAHGADWLKLKFFIFHTDQLKPLSWVFFR